MAFKGTASVILDDGTDRPSFPSTDRRFAASFPDSVSLEGVEQT
jgi:hypothetical protein